MNAYIHVSLACRMYIYFLHFSPTKKVKSFLQVKKMIIYNPPKVGIFVPSFQYTKILFYLYLLPVYNHMIRLFCSKLTFNSEIRQLSPSLA